MLSHVYRTVYLYCWCKSRPLSIVYTVQSTLSTAKLIIEFTKRLPGFASLHQQDQVTLLKVRVILC